MFKKLRLVLTLNCEDASRLMSDSFDRRLSPVERAALRCHLILCWSCRHFRQHLKVLARAMQSLSETAPSSSTVSAMEMSLEAKQRLKLAVKQRLDG